jgi:hypothetical protein
MPSAAMAAAAWSWVLKMLHEAQRTSAPRAVSVSISTAVWMVMCSEPVMRAPLRLGGGELLADRHQARHLGFGDADLLAAPVGQGEIGDDVIGELFSHSVHEISSNVWPGRDCAWLRVAHRVSPCPARVCKQSMDG